MNKQRDRGRILTPEALIKLQYAIRDWEVKHEKRCTQERMKELTSDFKEGGLDPGTISKILKGKGGVDPESIRCLFNAFGLVLEEADLVASTPFVLQVDPNFVGREGAIVDLNTLISRGAKVIVIQARGGVGKTTLARKYLQQEFDSVLEFPIAKETKDIASIESLIEEKLRQLGEEPGREFLVSIDRLKRKLQAEQMGILIDNLEPALDAAGKFIEPHRRYVELLRVLADPAVQSITLVTSRERLHEPGVSVQHYPLKSLDASAWEQFFLLRQLPISTPALAALHHAYGGNAKAMEIISSVIRTDYSGDVEAYWQENQDDLLIERDLEDLVTNQFERLQEVDPDAYRLLCRMGCYRYQDVPTVTTEGLLCLLWDVPESRQKRVIRSLQERSLVEFEGGEYWLHPVIRAEAIDRLRGSKDWEITNREAAGFWTERVKVVETIREATLALESCYHCIEISDFEQAASLLSKQRISKWDNWDDGEELGRSFQRLGLIQTITSIINRLLDQTHSEYFQSRLYHRLAVVHRLMGDMKKAIQYSEKVVSLTEKLLESTNFGSNTESCNSANKYRFELERMKVASLSNKGSCYLSLWSLEEAQTIFQEIDLLIRNTDLEKYLINHNSGLAFLNSELGLHDEAYFFIEKTLNQISSGRLNSFSWGYSYYFLGAAYQNLKNTEKSRAMYYQAISFSEDCNFTQLKAKALHGMAEIYRETGNFEASLSYHFEAIDLLDKIGAKYDLAEAYYQLGLTYKAINEDKEKNKSFQQAVQLFTEIEAPKQVERVRRSMEDRN